MSLMESYTCDVCGAKKAEHEQWWLMRAECSSGNGSAGDRQVLKLTSWSADKAHTPEAQHICGARCAGTLMDRWMTDQHENPNAECAS